MPKRVKLVAVWSIPVLIAQVANSLLTAGAAAAGQAMDSGGQVSLRAVALTFTIIFCVELRRYVGEYLRQRGQ